MADKNVLKSHTNKLDLILGYDATAPQVGSGMVDVVARSMFWGFHLPAHSIQLISWYIGV